MRNVYHHTKQLRVLRELAAPGRNAATRFDPRNVFCNSSRIFLLEAGEDKNLNETEDLVNKTLSPVTHLLAHGTSVTYSYSPSEPNPDPLAISVSPRSTLTRCEESLFTRQGDYWVIRYQGNIAFLRSTRGHCCLALLLRHPGREFHVSELLEQQSAQAPICKANGRENALSRVRRLFDAGAVLDAQAKAEYKSRLKDLRCDLEEAERSNDLAHAERARVEIEAIAEQLAALVGLGGRDRKFGSEAERARCAVTKRIKNSIKSIGEAIPSLRSHLSSHIKTGYFCSYNPDPERAVAWEF
jgi:hypothetical protein